MSTSPDERPNRVVFDAMDPASTRRLARALASVLPAGTLITLDGPLGAGKTFFVRALVEAWEVPIDDVNSPTFVLVNEYRGLRTVFHLDAYRLRDEDEFFELGADEWFESEAITLIEWAERIERCLPPAGIAVRIEVTGESSRRFQIEARSRNQAEAIVRLRAALAASSK